MGSDFSTLRPRPRRSDCKEDEGSSSRGEKTAHCFTCDEAAAESLISLSFFFLTTPPSHPRREREIGRGLRKDVEGCSSHPADSQPALHAALTLDQPQSRGFTEEEPNLLFIAPLPLCLPPPPSHNSCVPPPPCRLPPRPTRSH